MGKVSMTVEEIQVFTLYKYSEYQHQIRFLITETLILSIKHIVADRSLRASKNKNANGNFKLFKPTTYGLLGKVFDVDVLVCSQLLQYRLYFSLQRTANRETMR